MQTGWTDRRSDLQAPAAVLLTRGGRCCLCAARCATAEREEPTPERGRWDAGGVGRKTSGSARGASWRRTGEGFRLLLANSMLKSRKG